MCLSCLCLSCKFHSFKITFFTTPNNLSFSEHDDVSLNHLHNTLLPIEVLVYKHWIKCVLIDGGAGPNICTIKRIHALGFSNKAIDPKRKITIKAYDYEERGTKGLVVLPIKVGPIQKDAICQVFDIDLSYNVYSRVILGFMRCKQYHQHITDVSNLHTMDKKYQYQQTQILFIITTI